MVQPPPQGSQPLRFGRYAVYGQFAAGGMASVHVGRLLGEAGFTRTVAVKRLHPQYARDPQFVAMFTDEARIAGRIRHPNVVGVVDVVREGDELLLVMDYVHGESVSTLNRVFTRADARMPPSIAATIVVGALHGLESAHDATGDTGMPLGIVHRDVSPQNILVGRDGVPRVLDFGIAKATERLTQTRGGEVKGKLAYMSPEQLRGAQVDRRTDVYAAGVVLWELLTGRRLFAAEDPATTMARVVEGAKAPPSALAPDIPRALDPIVMRALAVDPAWRFSTAGELAAAIESVGCLVTQRQLGDWVASVAVEKLALRAAVLAEVERASSPGEDEPTALKGAPRKAGFGQTVKLDQDGPPSQPGGLNVPASVRSSPQAPPVRPVYPELPRSLASGPQPTASSAGAVGSAAGSSLRGVVLPEDAAPVVRKPGGKGLRVAAVLGALALLAVAGVASVRLWTSSHATAEAAALPRPELPAAQVTPPPPAPAVEPAPTAEPAVAPADPVAPSAPEGSAAAVASADAPPPNASAAAFPPFPVRGRMGPRPAAKPGSASSVAGRRIRDDL